MWNTERRIVCAAVSYNDEVFIGVRHFCPIMMKHMKEKGVMDDINSDNSICGFIDQNGVFMDRSESWDVAIDQGQVLFPIGRRGEKFMKAHEGKDLLFSEHLY